MNKWDSDVSLTLKVGNYSALNLVVEMIWAANVEL